MRTRSFWGAAATACLAFMLAAAQPSSAAEAEAPPAEAAKAKFESFASSFLLDPTRPENATCYISNVGKRAVAVKNFGLRQASGSVGAVTTSCGNPKSFNLKPGSTCFIGAKPTESVYCSAQADDVASLRGSLEERNASAAVTASIPMTIIQSTVASGDQFETIASAPIYGSQAQNLVNCILANVGDGKAKLRNVRFVSSTGQIFQPTQKLCYVDGVATSKADTLKPRTACVFTATPIPAIDLQCLAQVTRKSDIRGSVFLRTSDQAGNLNVSPMQ